MRPGIGPVAWGSDGSQSHVITQEPNCQDRHSDQPMVVRMEGTAVFRWAPFAMADVAREAVDGAGLEMTDVDAFIPHQANLRITETLARNLKLPETIAIARDVAGLRQHLRRVRAAGHRGDGPRWRGRAPATPRWPDRVIGTGPRQRGRDSNPRLTSLPATAFKAVPIGHSGTPPNTPALASGGTPRRV